MKDRLLAETGATSDMDLLPYEPPRVRVIEEEEVLSSFQVTQASLSWWYM
jgi:hypothetical protein